MADFDVNNNKKGNRKEREQERARKILAGNKTNIIQKEPIKEPIEVKKEELKVVESPKVEFKGVDIGKIGRDKTVKTLIVKENPTQSDTIKIKKVVIKRMTKKQKAEQERTIAKKNLFLEYFIKTLGSIKATCLKTGINRDTFYTWRNEDQQFYADIKKVEMIAVEDGYEGLMKGVLEGNMQAITFLLRNKHPDFIPKMKLLPGVGEQSLDDELAGYDFGDNGNTTTKTDLDKSKSN